ncbi:MAG: hypothetical protein AB8B77_07765 [Alphaproteobacteria bacterium]
MNKNSLNGILYALFLAIILAANPANATEKKIFSAIYTYEIEKTDIMPSSIRPDPQEPVSWLMIEFSKAQAQKFSELTKANQGRSIAIMVNDHLISTPTLMDHITGSHQSFPIKDDAPESLRSKLDDLDRLEFFIVEAHFTLPSDMMLPAAQPSFDLALKDDMRTTLCESPHIFLFEDDVLIAKSTKCNQETILFHHIQSP